ncbi:Peptidase M19 renal dipeptidase [Penicillium sp. DV-2018c]|nr:Peptidase M19 renal dipeptidase [Penicillium sp. DV-2018c]
MSEMSQEKGFLLESHQDQENDPILKQKRTPINPFWWLLLCIIGTTGWFTRSHHPCSHLSIEKRDLSIEERVQKILSQTPLFDGHDDFPIFVREAFQNRINSPDFTEPFVNGTLPGHVDIPRLRQGRVGGTFWSVFVPCPENGTDLSDENYAASVRETTEQIDVMARVQDAYPEVFSTPPNGTTAMSAFLEGKIISPLGIEGLHSIGNSLAHLRMFYELGVSYATLTHNCHNKYADAALLEIPGGGIRKAEPLWHGVSEEGQKVVFEMNRIGMIVDLAHVSAQTMRDVLGAGKSDWTGSRAPVIYSHSSAYAICPHPRNVPDDILELVRETDSLVMVNFSPDFISCTASDRADEMPKTNPDHATLERVADHILYIGNLIGFGHVGIGSDFDGIPTVPRGLEDVSKLPDLFKELLKRGLSDEDASKVAGGNLLRVWKKVDEVALEMQAGGALPVED